MPFEYVRLVLVDIDADNSDWTSSIKSSKILIGRVSGWVMLLVQADENGPTEIVK